MSGTLAPLRETFGGSCRAPLLGVQPPIERVDLAFAAPGEPAEDHLEVQLVR